MTPSSTLPAVHGAAVHGAALRVASSLQQSTTTAALTATADDTDTITTDTITTDMITAVHRSVRLAADLPAPERTTIEVLRTDTPLFARLVAARRNRTDDWYKVPAGYIDLCNVPLPVRISAPSPSG